MAETPATGSGNRSAEQATPSGRTSPMMRIAAVLFLAAVVLGECIVAYLLISRSAAENLAAASPPAPAETAKADHGKAEHPSTEEGKKGKEPGEAAQEESEEGLSRDQVEIDMEQFSVTAHQPSANTTIRIDFHLFGIIAAKDKEEFEKRLKANQHRFREQVLVTVRSAEGSDLADAGLGLIKRQILEKTNGLLGKPLLKSVIVSDFSYLEQ